MLILLSAIFGILVGILLNRAADNLPPPHRRSLLESPHCPKCDTPRTPLEQFGILSLVLRRTTCHNCNAPLGLRAPIVEIVTGVLFAFLSARYSFSLYLIIIWLFTALLILITVIDLEHKLILSVVVIPATLLAFLFSPLVYAGVNFTFETIRWNDYILALLGAVFGYVVTLIFYWFGIFFVRLVNRNRRSKINTVAFGFGDVRLGGFLGALIGFPAIFYALIYAVLLGGIGALAAILLRTLQHGRYSAFTAIPYGPYLVISGWAFLVFKPELMARLLGT